MTASEVGNVRPRITRFDQDAAELLGEARLRTCEQWAALACEFPAHAGAPGAARRLTVATLGGWGVGVDAVDDAALIVSELASNAVIHAESPFSISVELNDERVRIAVQDQLPPAPGVILGGLVPRPMRGLGVIDSISSAWGVEGCGQGKVVWAELGA